MDFAAAVIDTVKHIPPGKVLTYGDVAALSGFPGRARQVGKILGALGVDSGVPWHRVVNFQGRIAPHLPSQALLLKAEGIAVGANGHLNISHHRWKVFDI